MLFLYEEQLRSRDRHLLDMADAARAGQLFDGKHYSEWRAPLARSLRDAP